MHEGKLQAYVWHLDLQIALCCPSPYSEVHGKIKVINKSEWVYENVRVFGYRDWSIDVHSLKERRVSGRLQGKPRRPIIGILRYFVVLDSWTAPALLYYSRLRKPTTGTPAVLKQRQSQELLQYFSTNHRSSCRTLVPITGTPVVL